MRYRNSSKVAMLGNRVATIDLRPSTLIPAKAVKRTDTIYGSAQWKVLRARLIGERGSICQHCGKRGRVILDHIKELLDGGAPFDPGNLVFLCDRCHGAKTAAAAMERNGR